MKNTPATRTHMNQLRSSEHRRFAPKYPNRRERRALAKVSQRTLAKMVKDAPVAWYQSVIVTGALAIAVAFLAYKLLVP